MTKSTWPDDNQLILVVIWSVSITMLPKRFGIRLQLLFPAVTHNTTSINPVTQLVKKVICFGTTWRSNINGQPLDPYCNQGPTWLQPGFNPSKWFPRSKTPIPDRQWSCNQVNRLQNYLDKNQHSNKVARIFVRYHWNLTCQETRPHL